MTTLIMRDIMQADRIAEAQQKASTNKHRSPHGVYSFTLTGFTKLKYNSDRIKHTELENALDLYKALGYHITHHKDAETLTFRKRKRPAVREYLQENMDYRLARDGVEGIDSALKTESMALYTFTAAGRPIYVTAMNIQRVERHIRETFANVTCGPPQRITAKDMVTELDVV